MITRFIIELLIPASVLSRQIIHPIDETCIDMTKGECKTSDGETFLIQTRSTTLLLQNPMMPHKCQSLFVIAESPEHWDCYSRCVPVACDKCIYPIVNKRIKFNQDAGSLKRSPLHHISHYTQLCTKWGNKLAITLSAITSIIGAALTIIHIRQFNIPLIYQSIMNVVPPLIVMSLLLEFCEEFPATTTIPSSSPNTLLL